ncbi:hypothetical protein ZIOFF_051274 [Zingiber officinale]|uniref:Transmembrane protein n=1 Tax=Zingiber officinale TaxID=94328 RepID=A0A8J5KRT3_ZINOF|nr:hypothetical protein ZIOFF_051274 [Zingiber officinale]
MVSFDLAMILVNDLVASNVNLRWFLLLVMVSDSMNINVDFVMVSSYGVPILLLMIYMMEVRETPPRILWRACIWSWRGGEMPVKDKNWTFILSENKDTDEGEETGEGVDEGEEADEDVDGGEEAGVARPSA